MKVSLEKRVVIEMTVAEAEMFWRTYRPKPDTVGAALDKGVREALDEAARP